MKSSEILREAARLVERYEDTGDETAWPRFGCYAISAAMNGINSCWWFDDEYSLKKKTPAMRWFLKVKPSRVEDFWLGWFGEFSDARIIGLCLAAAIAESEGD